MINKFIYFIFLIFLFFLKSNFLFSKNEFLFESNTIEIINDGNTIVAKMVFK